MSSRGIYEKRQYREEVLEVIKHRKLEPPYLNHQKINNQNEINHGKK